MEIVCEFVTGFSHDTYTLPLAFPLSTAFPPLSMAYKMTLQWSLVSCSYSSLMQYCMTQDFTQNLTLTGRMPCVVRALINVDNFELDLHVNNTYFRVGA